MLRGMVGGWGERKGKLGAAGVREEREKKR